jgi:hypothetical protein
MNAVKPTAGSCSRLVEEFVDTIERLDDLVKRD